MAYTTSTMPAWYGFAGGPPGGAGGMAGSSYVTTSAINGAYTVARARAMTMTADDVIIDGVSLKESIKSINERLAILTPDLEKLEKYASLKQAYDHYKMLEALIGNDEGTPTIE